MGKLLEDLEVYFFRRYRTLAVLLSLNIGLYLLVGVGAVGATLLGKLDTYKSQLMYLYLPAGKEFFVRPWTLVTHMFTHDPVGVWHILFNMLWLYWMGKLFIGVQPHIRLAYLYGIGGLMGGLGFWAYAALLGKGGYALGASAAVNAITYATIALMPRFPVFLLFLGLIELRWIGLIFFFLDLLLIPSGQWGTAAAHLSGSLSGLLMGWLLKKGWKPETMLTLPQRTPSTPPTEEVDRILEKIHQKGMQSLTRREKEILRRASEEL
ncbi:MAG: rhomboid family intramembrane serine protease [Bacteroidia bacterium]